MNSFLLVLMVLAALAVVCVAVLRSRRALPRPAAPLAPIRHALVVYESMYGNTERVARAIAEGLSGAATVEVIEVGEAPAELPPGVDLLVVGSPTHAFGMSRPQTRADAARQAGARVISERTGVREWLSSLRPASPAMAALAFDTHASHPRFFRHIGSAAAGIAKSLARLGFGVAATPEHFWVGGTQGPLDPGEEQRARAWARGLLHPPATKPSTAPSPHPEASGSTS
jgi:hypothetical protein